MKKNIYLAGLMFLLVTCRKEQTAGDNNNPGNLNTISMRGSVFSPSGLQVNINSTVTWINDDNMVHTVTSDNGTFNSGDIAPGGRFSYSFSNTGTFQYHCMHHSGMAGSITVAGIR